MLHSCKTHHINLVISDDGQHRQLLVRDFEHNHTSPNCLLLQASFDSDQTYHDSQLGNHGCIIKTLEVSKRCCQDDQERRSREFRGGRK